MNQNIEKTDFNESKKDIKSSKSTEIEFDKNASGSLNKLSNLNINDS